MKWLAAALPALGLVLWHLVELMLGVVTPEEAGWLPVTLKSNLGRILGWFSSKKEVSHMPSKNPNAISVQVDVDKPVRDAFTLAADAVRKLGAGEKPPQVAQEEIGGAMILLTELPLVAGDAALDRATFIRAFMLGSADVLIAILDVRDAKAAALPK